jgi:hypothetical protein
MSSSILDNRNVAGRVASAANMAAKVGWADYGVPEAPAVANDPAQRTSSNIALRDQRLREFRALASRVVGIVRGNPDLDDKQLEDLGVRLIRTRRKIVPAPDRGAGHHGPH